MKTANKEVVDIEIKGFGGSPHKVHRGVIDLIRSLIELANLTGFFTFNVVGNNRAEHFNGRGIKMKPANNGNGCCMIARVDGDHQYAGYLFSKNGLSTRELYEKLIPVTNKNYFYPDQLPRKGEFLVSEQQNRKLDLTTEIGVVETIRPVKTSPVEISRMIEVPHTSFVENVVQNDVLQNPVIPPFSESQPKKTLKDYSSDVDSLKLIVMAIQYHYPDGVAPAKGLASKIIKQMNLDAEPHCIGPILRAICNRGLLLIQQEKPLIYRIPGVGVANPVVTPVAPTISQPTVSASVATATGDDAFLTRMTQMFVMSKEFAMAQQEAGGIQAKLTATLDQIRSLQEVADQFTVLQKKYSAILDSEPHQKAHALVASIRESGI